MITAFDRVKLDERRETILLQLEVKFGPLPTEVVQRVMALNLIQLRRISVDLLKAASPTELPLLGSSESARE